jgi:hypothetical protein
MAGVSTFAAMKTVNNHLLMAEDSLASEREMLQQRLTTLEAELLWEKGLRKKL